MKRRRITLFFLAGFSFVALVFASAAYYFLFTAAGGRSIVMRFLQRYESSFTARLEKIDGNLAQQLVLRDIELKNIHGWPDDVIIRIQKADIYFVSIDLKSINIEIHNARLLSPALGTIVIYAAYQDEKLEAEVFSSRLELGELGRIFPQVAFLKHSSGSASDLNINVKGDLAALVLAGGFRIDSFSKEALLLKDIPANFNLEVRDLSQGSGFFGEVVAEGGAIVLPRATFDLQPSRLIFKGDPANPSLEMTGTSKVENITVKAVLRGDMLSPVLKLSSDPSMPQEKLLIMLLTGIGDISFKYDEESKEFGLKKGVTDRVGVSYGSQQPQAQAASSQATQKLGVSYKVAEGLYIEGEKELQSQSIHGNQTKVKPADDAVFLKYRKNF